MQAATCGPIFLQKKLHTSLGVFAKCRLTYNEVVKGLTGFLVPIPQKEIIPSYNNVSIFDHASGPKLKGGVSFVNSSFKENCLYVPNRNKTKVCIRLTAIKGIQKEKRLMSILEVKNSGQTECFATARIQLSVVLMQLLSIRGPDPVE